MYWIGFNLNFKEVYSDYRPVKFPKYPYWCTGEGSDYYTMVAYAESWDELLEYWPEATERFIDEVKKVDFTDRFPKPQWWGKKRIKNKEDYIRHTEIKKVLNKPIQTLEELRELLDYYTDDTNICLNINGAEVKISDILYDPIQDKLIINHYD